MMAWGPPFETSKTDKENSKEAVPKLATKKTILADCGQLFNAASRTAKFFNKNAHFVDEYQGFTVHLCNGILEAYTGIIQGLKDGGRVDLIYRIRRYPHLCFAL